ncbi:MAG: hypothetical protein OXG42_06940, partial [Chloroflexi bacterium]|nr:hypothetical protein [Chloroflexota bacterium]
MTGAAMAADIEQVTVRHSVQDVIRNLENEPVRPDFVGQITAVQIIDRVTRAHLSIERALKFLITRAGGPQKRDHHLGDRLRELAQHEPDSAEFLIHAFAVAVRHYRFNPNADDAKHLKSLESYLDVACTHKAFRDLRYWELDQSNDEALLRRLCLPLHMELLHAVDELLRGRTPTDTVASRVERAVKQAMWPASDLAYAPGTPKEESVRAYWEWCRGFPSWSDALTDAARQQFMIGDDFANGMVVGAHRALLESMDPAVSYFAGTLDVLPRQPRDVIPPVEWLGDPPQQRGFVNAPSGATLGLIERRWDGLWSVTPLHEGLVAVAAKAATQTDAQSYLATLFVRDAEVTVNGERRPLRIVASEQTLFGWNQARFRGVDDPSTGEETWSQEVVFWEADH